MCSIQKFLFFPLPSLRFLKQKYWDCGSCLQAGCGPEDWDKAKSWHHLWHMKREWSCVCSSPSGLHMPHLQLWSCAAAHKSNVELMCSWLAGHVQCCMLTHMAQALHWSCRKGQPGFGACGPLGRRVQWWLTGDRGIISSVCSTSSSSAPLQLFSFPSASSQPSSQNLSIQRWSRRCPGGC